MSFIQFESGWEKEKARQELREVRAELLKRAEQKAKRHDEQELQRKFRGDDQWMLPSVSEKIDQASNDDGGSIKSEQKSDKRSKNSKKSKKSTSKKAKKEKKKKSKKKKRSSTSDSNDGSSSDEAKITKRKRKRKHFSDAESSESSSSESDEEEDAWVEKSSEDIRAEKKDKPMQRDDWLGGLSISTFPKKSEPKEKKKEERKDIDSYDPSKSGRELNPYWKNGGSGLPTSFTKPNYDSDNDDDEHSSKYSARVTQSERNEKYQKRQSNWKKKIENEASSSTQSTDRFKSPQRQRNRRSSSNSSTSSRSHPPIEKKSNAVAQTEPESSRADFLTDQQMNELGAKLVKAEIMGNDELVKELKEKLDKARQYRSDHKKDVLTKSFDRRSGRDIVSTDRREKDEKILLTTTNSKGVSRPVAQTHSENDLWGGRAGRKAKKQKPVETHSAGERVRYFADDDKYDIKQMFEREKFTSAADQDMEFANIAGTYKNPNDDLDDIFTEKVRKAIDGHDLDKKERDRAIRDHQNLARTLDACDKCFDSPKLEKQLIVAMGTNVYLSLPWHEGLQPGHCIIAPLSHVPCATQLDDDVWVEIRDFMKALDRMFAARKQDVIFFETARNLHRRPHMVIHCVPSGQFEMAPFYFKKAIQEAETEWATNKQLVSLKDRDVRRAIPKGLPYFWVNFGMSSGFAHVIEEQDRFPSNFAQEIIGGLLNLDSRLWRRPRKLHNPIPKVKQFADWWKPFDATK